MIIFVSINTVQNVIYISCEMWEPNNFHRWQIIWSVGKYAELGLSVDIYVLPSRTELVVL